MKSAIYVLVASLLPTALAAQSPAPQPVSAVLTRSFDRVSSFIVRSADQVADADYAFKATPAVRSFAAEIGHVIDSHYAFCSRARNQPSPLKESVEATVTTKADLTRLLKESVVYCKSAYEGMKDDQLSQQFEVGEAKGILFGPLANNIGHDNEHYGKIVTIIRLLGGVPPSSQPNSPR